MPSLRSAARFACARAALQRKGRLPRPASAVPTVARRFVNAPSAPIGRLEGLAAHVHATEPNELKRIRFNRRAVFTLAEVIPRFLQSLHVSPGVFPEGGSRRVADDARVLRLASRSMRWDRSNPGGLAMGCASETRRATQTDALGRAKVLGNVGRATNGSII